MVLKKAKDLNIVIVGCGKVGGILVDQLSKENYDITVIDTKADKVNTITTQFDVTGVIGNGASISTQIEAGVDKADIFISVTDSDELNLLCCVVAKRNSGCAVIARVRTPEYSQDAAYLKDKLGLAMIINPDRLTALTVARNLYLPSAIGVKGFAAGRAEMSRVRVREASLIVGRPLRELSLEFSGPILMCAVERGGQVFIPRGDFSLQAGDVATFICPSRESRTYLRRMGFDVHPIRSALLVGGSKICYYLAKELVKGDIQVKIIESNAARSHELSELLPEAVVIHGDGADADMLRQAGIEDMGAVVSLTGMDEENILLSLHAEEVSHAKVVTKINRVSFPEAISRLNLGSIVCPKQLTADAILAFVRGRSVTRGSNVENLVRLFDDRVEALEFCAEADSPVLDTPLSSLKLLDSLLVAGIIRGSEFIVPGGSDMIRKGDRVIVVTTHTGLRDLSAILQ